MSPKVLSLGPNLRQLKASTFTTFYQRLGSKLKVSPARNFPTTSKSAVEAK